MQPPTTTRCFIILLLVFSLASPINAQQQQQRETTTSSISYGCPLGSPVIQLDSDSTFAQSNGSKWEAPVVALPSQLTTPITAATNGTWSSNNTNNTLTWQLCLSTASTVNHLTLLFSSLQLPLHSELLIYSTTPEHNNIYGNTNECEKPYCHRVTPFTWQAAAAGGRYTSPPLPGSSVVVEYRQGLEGWVYLGNPTIEIDGMLQGLLPLPFISSTTTGAYQQLQQQQKDEKEPHVTKQDDNDTKTPRTTNDTTITLTAAQQRPSSSSSSQQQQQPLGQGITSQTQISAVADRISNNDIIKQADTRLGEALPCLIDAYCDAKWRTSADGVVLLLINSLKGTSFCTGTLIAGPDPNEQLVLTANHCRGQSDDLTIKTMWSVLVSRETECNQVIDSSSSSSGSGSSRGGHATSAGGSSSSSMNVPMYEVIQGLEIVFSDEGTDTLLLKLLNPIPQDFQPYFLGWDATTPLLPVPSGGVTIHHSSGDVKKLTITSDPLLPYSWKDATTATHYKAYWTTGVTEVGSSGASLLRNDSGLVVGVLTGGTIGGTCSGGSDLFGTLGAAWGKGLWKVLSPDGIDVYRTMQGRQGTNVVSGGGGSGTNGGISLAIDPPVVILPENGIARLQLTLSAPPSNPTDTITVSVYINQPTTPAVAVEAVTPTLTFTSTTWNKTQLLEVVPAQDTLQTGPLPFQIVFDLSSATDPTFARRQIIPGLRTDAQTPPGASPTDALIIQEGGPNGIMATMQDAVVAGVSTLLTTAATTTESGTGVNNNSNVATPVGISLSDWAAAQPVGTAKYYNLSTGSSMIANIVACTVDGSPPLEVVLFANTTSLLSSARECSNRGSSTTDCTTVIDKSQQQPMTPNGAAGTCSGFLRLEITGLGDNPEYTFAVRSLSGAASAYILRFIQLDGGGSSLFFGP